MSASVDGEEPCGVWPNKSDIAKQLVAAAGVVEGQDPEEAVLEAYHSTLVPPFCLAAVRRFFDAR